MADGFDFSLVGVRIGWIVGLEALIRRVVVITRVVVERKTPGPVDLLDASCLGQMQRGRRGGAAGDGCFKHGANKVESPSDVVVTDVEFDGGFFDGEAPEDAGVGDTLQGDRPLVQIQGDEGEDGAGDALDESADTGAKNADGLLHERGEFDDAFAFLEDGQDELTIGIRQVGGAGNECFGSLSAVATTEVFGFSELRCAGGRRATIRGCALLHV